MARVHNCTTPQEAWALVSHHLGNGLLVIGMTAERLEDTTPGSGKDQLEDRLWRNHMELTGALYILTQRMKMLGFIDDGLRLEALAHTVAAGDVSKQEVRDVISKLHDQADPGMKALEQKVDELNAAKEKDGLAEDLNRSMRR